MIHKPIGQISNASMCAAHKPHLRECRASALSSALPNRIADQPRDSAVKRSHYTMVAISTATSQGVG